jgi:hypothetical protein
MFQTIVMGLKWESFPFNMETRDEDVSIAALRYYYMYMYCSCGQCQGRGQTWTRQKGIPVVVSQA